MSAEEPLPLSELGCGILLTTASPDLTPKVLRYKGHGYRRFMDHLFLPCRTDRLSVEQVKVINRYREATFNADPQFVLNASVKARVAASLAALETTSLLEVGCGRFPINTLLPNIRKYTCVEIDDVAITENRILGTDCITLREFRSDKFKYDAFVALFALQFNVTQSLIQALSDRTVDIGIGIVNLLGVNLDLRQRRIHAFIRAGFHVLPIRDTHPKLRKNEFLILTKRKSRRILSGHVALLKRELLPPHLSN